MSAFDELRAIGNSHRECIVPTVVVDKINEAMRKGENMTEPWKITEEHLENFRKSFEGNQSNYMRMFQTYRFDVDKLKPEMFIKVTHHEKNDMVQHGVIFDVTPTTIEFVCVSDAKTCMERLIYADGVTDGRYSFEIVDDTPKVTNVHNVEIKMDLKNFVADITEQLKKKGVVLT